MRRSLLVFIVILLSASAADSQDKPDLLQAALDSIGFTRADLGVQPKGYWGRFPTDIPYKLKCFDDLFAEPLRLYDYGKSFGGVLETFGDPARLDSLDDNLYNLVYFLGVERKTGGFRSYGANLSGLPETDRPLYRALETLYLTAGTPLPLMAFNKKPDWPDREKDLDRQIAPLTLPVRQALAALVDNLREIIRWRNLAVRDIPAETMQKVFRIRDLAETQDDAKVYYPEIDVAAGALDMESLCYAALKAAAAAERADRQLSALAAEVPPDFSLDFPTPYGRFVVNGPANNRLDADDCLLIVDFGGDDVYTGPAGATSAPDRGVSVIIDLGGNDTYTDDRLVTPSQGAGILGVGLLYDAAGSDRYQGRVFSQGAGFLGIGVLYDKSGGDDYRAETSSQGAGYFGIGLAIDGDGDDSYYLYAEGQGMGGVGGGIGCLADYAGNDIYTAETSPEVINRGDYHSDFAININNVQGVGSGRRGDGADGHSWAGGLGVIVDLHGDDQYLSGNWSLGCGYWFGTGICYDGDGDDLYRSVYFTQASGAHFCNGVLIDEAGDDKHLLYETAGAALGFGWDFTNALFVDRGGNDQYEAKMISYGLAQIRSFAFFFDMGGVDSYTYAPGQQGFGAATFRKDFAKPSPLMTYYYYARSAGIFIDADGTDSYLIQQDGKVVAADKMKDNSVWYTPEKTDDHYGHNNFGIGLDSEGGCIPELDIFD